MNRKALIFFAAVLCTITVFSACGILGSVNEETSIEIITEAPFGTPEETETQNNGAEKETSAEEKTTAEATTEEITEEATTEIKEEATTEEKNSSEALLGYTKNGFAVTRKDSLTYVDGILIANKTYSLPSDYNPGNLLPECEAAFAQLKSAAAKNGHNIWNASGFRSYDHQNRLYTKYSDRDGKDAADRYSARPGHSEHQTGLAIDLNEISSSFADTAAGKWIEGNCHKYGFILRYPKGKEAQTGYMYEPWHIRYVGIEAAAAIYESGLCLEEYYGISSSYNIAASDDIESETAEQINFG